MGRIRVADLIQAADEAGVALTPGNLLKPTWGSLRRKAEPEEAAAVESAAPTDPPTAQGVSRPGVARDNVSLSSVG